MWELCVRAVGYKQWLPSVTWRQPAVGFPVCFPTDTSNTAAAPRVSPPSCHCIMNGGRRTPKQNPDSPSQKERRTMPPLPKAISRSPLQSVKPDGGQKKSTGFGVFMVQKFILFLLSIGGGNLFCCR